MVKWMNVSTLDSKLTASRTRLNVVFQKCKNMPFLLFLLMLGVCKQITNILRYISYYRKSFRKQFRLSILLGFVLFGKI